jgi:CelD/BcsL family acetyltransferase involved in cellulose biosynthesis
MHVLRYDNLKALAPFAEQWDSLAAGNPFRCWSWATRWWRHYGPETRRTLYVVAAHDSSHRLVAMLPCYCEPSTAHGRTLRLLGSGEVCSDYLGLLCQPGQEAVASEAIALWLVEQGVSTHAADQRWDLLRLENIDAQDRATLCLAEQLEQAGAWVHRRPGANCWRVELPTAWDQYLECLSKSHRRQVLRAERRLFQPGHAVLRTAERCDELPAAMDLLERLHQRRRRQLNQPGCFASERFTAFHRDVVGPMLAQGQLQLQWLELDGRAVAAEYQLLGNGLVFAYQAGIDPDVLEVQPGSLITLAVLRRSMELGFRGFDFLRGDEPYKAHWRAAPRPSIEIRVAANRATARLRQRIWLAGARMKRILAGELQ